MKRPGYLVFVIVALLCCSQCHAATIADHTRIDIAAIPQSAIEQAKATLHIAYGHTSHGSQITTGMSGLVGFANGGGLGLSFPADIFAWNNGGTGGALDLHDQFVAGDLGGPDRYTWAQRTRDYLDNAANSDVNVIMWSWCGQAATSIANIDIYLNLMEGLITDYPSVHFVFMAGHLDGTGPDGLLNLANEHIRNHCTANDRILFDFADIESYDPNGLINYMELNATDSCWYDSDGNGSRESNWAIDWQNSHTVGADWYNCSSSHTYPLNANMKAYAAWWLWARIAGWGGTVDINDYLVGHWKLDDGAGDAVVVDSSGNSHDGVAGQNTCLLSWPGVDGGCLDFDGVSDYVAVPDSSEWSFGGDFTITLWARFDSFNTKWWESAFVGHDEGSDNSEDAVPRKWAGYRRGDDDGESMDCGNGNMVLRWYLPQREHVHILSEWRF